MNTPMIKSLAASLIVVLILLVFGVPKSLGAHPWWASNVILFGAPLGTIIGLGLALWRPKVLIISLVLLALTLLAFLIARSGGNAFAASYAEDQAAGQRWFMGWNATIAALLATVSYSAKR